MNDDRYSPPSVSITIELEGMPKVVWNARTDEQAKRLHDWLGANPALLDLLGRALLANPSSASAAR